MLTIFTLIFSTVVVKPAPDTAAIFTPSSTPDTSVTALTHPTSDTASTPAPASGWSFNGSADAYYRYDLARTDRNALTSFTHSNNQLNLGMISAKVEYKTTRFDVLVDLGVGPREREYAYTDRGITQPIKQFYLSYSPLDWLKITAGMWSTHLCYEQLDAPANRNYSMSYIFTNTVFAHTGVRANITLGKNSLMIGIANPGDYRTVPAAGFNNKQILAQYTYNPNDDLSISFNYVGGRDINNDRMHQYDLTLSDKFSRVFSLGFNSSTNVTSIAAEKYNYSRTWFSNALYLNLDPKKWFGLTLRTEYFRDPDGRTLSAPASIFANTLSANFKTHGFCVIPEFRLDHATAPVFFDHAGNPASSAANFLVAIMYSL